MKKVLLTTALLLIMGLHLCFAQKSQSSDYNLRKAYELLEQKDEKEAMKYINQYINENPKSSNGYIFRAGLYQNQNKFGQALMDINNAIKHWDKTKMFPSMLLIGGELIFMSIWKCTTKPLLTFRLPTR